MLLKSINVQIKMSDSIYEFFKQNDILILPDFSEVEERKQIEIAFLSELLDSAKKEVK